jgi:hypothetical protein
VGIAGEFGLRQSLLEALRANKIACDVCKHLYA